MVRKLLIIAALVLACVSPSLGQHYIAPTIVNNLGQPVPNASIRVCTEPAVGYPCTNTATLYTCIAQNGSCPAPNPLTGDADGNFDFYATNTLIYHFEITGPSLVPYIQSYVYMPGPPGGGGASPCGVTNDVQTNGGSGSFGCDTGIFTENPSTHTAYDYVFSADRELQVGDATHTGFVSIGHSNGSTNNANFVTGLASTFSTTNGGYGISWPDSPAIGFLNITSLTPVNGLLPTAWSTAGAGVNIFAEYMTPVFTTNCPQYLGTPCSDIVDTLEYWEQSTSFMGPLPPTFPASAFVQDATCAVGAISPITCTLPNPFIPGDTLYVVSTAVVGTDQNVTFAFADTNSDVFTPIDTVCPSTCISGTYPGANAYTVPAITTGGNIAVTMTPTCPSCFVPDSVSMHIMELRPTTGVDVHTASTPTFVGGTITFGSISTANAQDVIIASTGMDITVGNVFSAGTGYQMINQIITANAFGNYGTLGTEATGVSSTGTYTPTMSYSASSLGGNGFVVAFKNAAATNRAQPFPRYIHPIDLQARSIAAIGSGTAGECLSNDGNPDDVLPWIACGGSSGGLSISTPTPAGIVLSNGSTTSVYSQTTATIDAGGDALFNGTVTSGNGGAPYYDLFLGFNSSQPAGCGIAGTACIYTLIGSPNTLMAAVDGSTPFVLGSTAGAVITGTPTQNYIQKGGASSGTIVNSSLIDNATNVTTTEPILSGTDNSVAGIFTASNSAANAHTNWESGATTTNTIKGFATAPTTGDLVSCTTSGIICLLTDSGVLGANVVVASSPGAGIARFAGSTQTVTSAELSGFATTSGSNVVSPAHVTTGKTLTIDSGGTLTCAAGSTCPGSGTVGSGTATHMAYYASTGTAVADMGADFTFLTHTMTVGTSGIFTYTGSGEINANYLGGTSIGTPTGTINAVFSNSPTLVTPALGAATATSLLASGIVDGAAPVTITTGSSATLGGTYKSGYTLNQEASAATAITYTLPTAAAGLQYCVANSQSSGTPDTGTLEILTSASGQYIEFTNGTLSASGGYVISGGAAADAACVVGESSTVWKLYVQSGTWAKH